MDAQHDVLISLIARLMERDAAGALKGELCLLLRELTTFTSDHFKDEEVYMLATGYGKLDTHQLIHRKLLAALSGHVVDFEAGNGRLGNKLVSFLKFWLVAHINGLDSQLARPVTPLSSRAVPRRSS